MFGVLRREERALMVVEPPGHLGAGAILEIDNGVLVAVEQAFVEQLRRFVGQAAINKFGVRIEGFLHETAEVGGGCRPVEAVVVIEDSNPHAVSESENLTACLNVNEKAIG